TIENYLAYIDGEKCKNCRKCAPVCKSNSIHEINFPPRKERPEKPERVKKERPERKVKPAATETATLEKETDIDVIELVKKANEDNSKEQNSEEKA
ncbi:MAG: 4Fe-4S binding protein, partial [Cyclobacteriaceae bacterium]|nr:4Fe-4S binding protein [Cyclobacteriaceae bacterium]